jgi:hypothetical protein
LAKIDLELWIYSGNELGYLFFAGPAIARDLFLDRVWSIAQNLEAFPSGNCLYLIDKDIKQGGISVLGKGLSPLGIRWNCQFNHP